MMYLLRKSDVIRFARNDVALSVRNDVALSVGSDVMFAHCGEGRTSLT